MTQDEALIFFKKNPNDSIYIYSGIESLNKNISYLLFEPVNKCLLFYSNEKTPTLKKIVYIHTITNIQYAVEHPVLHDILITYTDNNSTKEISFAVSTLFSKEKKSMALLKKLFSYIQIPENKNSDEPVTMSPVEMTALYHSNKYPKHDIRISCGIDVFLGKRSGYADLIFDKNNKKLLFFTSGKTPTIEAVLSIDKITDIQFGSRNSPISKKGIEPTSENILILYTSNETEKELLFSGIDFGAERKFIDLYNELLPFINKSQLPNDTGVIEL